MQCTHMGIHVSMHIHFNAYSFLCIFITMHIHFYAYSLPYIFISMHIHFLCIFIAIHIQIYTYSPPCIFTSLCLYKLQPKPFDRQRYTDIDRTGQTRTDTHIRLQKILHDRIPIIRDCRLSGWFNYKLCDCHSCLVIISHIAKQYFTRLHCDSSK